MKIPVSVIIPCYRCSHTIERALKSVLKQTAQPAEIFLIDDASGDDTLQTLYKLQARWPDQLRVIEQKVNGGPGLARNAGWEAATQPWLAFLDADDTWHPQKLEIQWAFHQMQPSAVLSGHLTHIYKGSNDHTMYESPSTTPLTLTRMLCSNMLPTRSVMLRRELSFRFSDRRLAEDYQLWLHIIASGQQAFRIEAPLAYSYRPDFSPGGLSGQLWKHEKSEQEVLRLLWKSGNIPFPVWILAATWSSIKFVRRLFLMRSV